MKGLELAERYYEEVGRPALASWLGADENRVAAGLVGEGSECFGFDDEISRDHDWGPGFCLWLTADDHARFGADLQERYDSLSTSYGGFGPRVVTADAGKRTGVFAITDFYRRFIRYDHVPQTLAEWRSLPETYLATATNGRVFSDPLGKFTAFREGLLAFYPEDLRLKKLAARCFTAGQTGQYNYGRSVARGEWVAAQCGLSQFVEAVISLVYLLNKRYRPFYKWMHRGLRELPVLGEECYRLLGSLCAEPGAGATDGAMGRARGDGATDGAMGRGQGAAGQPGDAAAGVAGASAAAGILEERERIVEKVSAMIIAHLTVEGLSDSESDFLLDHAYSVQARIANDALRSLPVMME